jgi:hypothetical protein
MLKPELYQKTVDILVQAYFDGTLIKGNCTACAIGNIVAFNLGISIPKDQILNHLSIKQVTELTGQVSMGNYSFSTNQAIINATGYSFEQLSLIEEAFESNSKIHWLNYHQYTEKKILQDQFKGLMAVVDVLDEIHENLDTEISIASKKKFNRVGVSERSVATEVK